MNTIKHCLKIMIKLCSIGIIVLFMFGCSKELSRDESKKLIIQKYNFPYDETREINLFQQTSTEFKSTSGDAHNIPPKQGVMLNLEQAGLITYNIERTSFNTREVWWDGPLGFSAPNETVRNAHRQKGYRQEFITKETYNHIGNLTEKGRQYLAAGGVKVAKIEFGEITGIVERKEFNIAEVNFTERRQDITPFGRALNIYEETFNRSATFTRYDDGWRINQ